MSVADVQQFRAERRHRIREKEARDARTVLDKAHVRARHIIEDATREAKLQAKAIILQAERQAALVTEQAYNRGMAKADAKVIANEKRRKSLDANKKRTTQ
ncbi:hypothetical protein [Glutamicibacter sp. 2E12]|uniref:hypothetical protein n=1 Tax=Glutamicibacter sp. 2E12 TaxID=3416181 RepID=UPI003CEB4518